MNQESYQRARALGLCSRCLCVFINPKNEEIFLEEDGIIQEYVKNKLALVELQSPSESRICPCCMNCLHKIRQIAEVIDTRITAESQVFSHDSQSSIIYLNVITPPILETVRITCRTIVTLIGVKAAPFPCWDELIARLLGQLLGGRRVICGKVDKAKLKVDIVLGFHDEAGLALAIDPGFQKSKKRRAQGVQLQTALNHEYNFEIKDQDNVLVVVKENTKSLRLVEQMSERLRKYFENLAAAAVTLPPATESLADHTLLLLPLVWKFTVNTQPVYLIGRYRKFSREISQARWTLTEEGDEGAELEAGRTVGRVPGAGGSEEEVEECVVNSFRNANEVKDSSLKGGRSVRKGKMSVEEVVCEAVNHVMRARNSRLHPCGREDIDVRMLGNGRPFVLEVLEAKNIPSRDVLQEAIDFVKLRKGLNVDGEVEILCLEETSHETWTTMQHVAEEKRKAYSCVCWSAVKLTREIIENIDTITQTCGNVDGEGTPCLEITQKTPLRVLHRRSLLTRTRYIYSLSAARLNDHYFVLNVITSAGAYVKEFVHGDLGRTFPSISTILGSPTDILQLDVTWLFDSFIGNGNDLLEDTTPSSSAALRKIIIKNTSSSNSNRSGCEKYEAVEIPHAIMSWDALRSMKLSSFKGNVTQAIMTPLSLSKLRYGIMGTSFISGVMIDAIRLSKEGEVYCVSSRTAASLNEFAGKYKVSVTYTDYDDMLADPLVDVVYIGLPTYLHSYWVERAACAGKHILNEKSFSLSANQAITALNVVREKKVFCMEANMMRCHPILSRLANIIHNERPVGAAKYVTATFTANIINLFNRRAGGSILDLGCYPMSLVRYLFGEPLSITATGSIVRPEKIGDNAFDSETTATLELPAGLQAVIHTSNNADHKWEFHVSCEDGQISLSDLWNNDDNAKHTITITKKTDSGLLDVQTVVMNPPESFYTLQINTVNYHIRCGDVQAVAPAMNWQDSINNMIALDKWRAAVGLKYLEYE